MAPDSPVSDAQSRNDAEQLSAMYRAIDECPCPVIGRVNGPAFGGGVGLLAVCDIVVATEDVTFALSETRIGLVPAVIAPFLLRKAGESFLRRYCLTGEVFSTSVAKQFNLVHEIVKRDNLDTRVFELIQAVKHVAPQAARNTKVLLRTLLCMDEPDRRSVSAEANARALAFGRSKGRHPSLCGQTAAGLVAAEIRMIIALTPLLSYWERVKRDSLSLAPRGRGKGEGSSDWIMRRICD